MFWGSVTGQKADVDAPVDALLMPCGCPVDAHLLFKFRSGVERGRACCSGVSASSIFNR
jgi:hypothetical protein